MVVLGCDPSISDFGWAVLDVDTDGSADLLDSGRIRTSSDQLDVMRYRVHRRRIGELFEKHADNVDAVGVEQPPPQASYSAGLWPLWVFCSEECLENRVDQFNFSPSTLKANVRSVLGESGRMRKKHMKRAASILLDMEEDESINHNVADAVHVGHAAARLAQLITGEIHDSDLSDREAEFLVKHRTKRNGDLKLSGMIYKEDDRYRLWKSPKYDHLYEDVRT